MQHPSPQELATMISRKSFLPQSHKKINMTTYDHYRADKTAEKLRAEIEIMRRYCGVKNLNTRRKHSIVIKVKAKIACVIAKIFKL